MQTTLITVETIVEENCLSLEEFASLCAVEPDWVIQHIHDGLLSGVSQENDHWRFSTMQLTRAKRILTIERNFEASPELAALVADMQEEMDRLRRQLHRAGL